MTRNFAGLDRLRGLVINLARGPDEHYKIRIQPGSAGMGQESPGIELQYVHQAFIAVWRVQSSPEDAWAGEEEAAMNPSREGLGTVSSFPGSHNSHFTLLAIQFESSSYRSVCFYPR